MQRKSVPQESLRHAFSVRVLFVILGTAVRDWAIGPGRQTAAVRLQLDLVAVPRRTLPLEAVFPLAGEQARHNGGNRTAMGHDQCVPRPDQPLKGPPDPGRHLPAALSARTALVLVVSADPGLIVRAFGQLLIRMQLKHAEIQLPQIGLNLVGHRTEESLQRLLCPHHSAGINGIARPLRVSGALTQVQQLGQSPIRQGQVA